MLCNANIFLVRSVVENGGACVETEPRIRILMSVSARRQYYVDFISLPHWFMPLAGCRWMSGLKSEGAYMEGGKLVSRQMGKQAPTLASGQSGWLGSDIVRASGGGDEVWL